ncbi:MAG: hypothetical protein U5K37_03600 [Natrialbaceae archaeon]|nr:hypothetical protein [Natrialbaceae archaeon]
MEHPAHARPRARDTQHRDLVDLRCGVAPLYTMFLGWALGRPRDGQSLTMGVVYLVGLTTALWLSLTVLTLLIGVVFY